MNTAADLEYYLGRKPSTEEIEGAFELSRARFKRSKLT